VRENASINSFGWQLDGFGCKLFETETETCGWQPIFFIYAFLEMHFLAMSYNEQVATDDCNV
jgi:hypothetical protein